MAKLDTNKIYCGDCNEVLQDIPSNSIDLVITSPPYFQQREYGGGNGVGNEKKVEEYIESIMKTFRECVRVTKKTGSIVFNLGDKYIDGNLLLVPYRFAIEVQKEKLAKLINELTWVKVNPAPKQDPRKLVSSTEPFFIFVKSNEYYFNKDAFMEYRDKYMNGSKKTAGNDIGKNILNLLKKHISQKKIKNKQKKNYQK